MRTPRVFEKQAKIDKKRKGGVDVAREVILFIAASIDGFIADKAGGVAWLEEIFVAMKKIVVTMKCMKK